MSVETFGNFATSSMIAEATAFKTVKAGSYVLQVNKQYEINEDEGWARLGGRVIIDGTPRGSVFFKVQWKEERGDNGKLKTPCRLFAQLLRSLHPKDTADELSKIDAVTLISEAEKYPVQAYIGEFYKVPDTSNKYGSTRKYPKTPEEVKVVLEQGGVPGNDVVSISPMR